MSRLTYIDKEQAEEAEKECIDRGCIFIGETVEWDRQYRTSHTKEFFHKETDHRFEITHQDEGYGDMENRQMGQDIMLFLLFILIVVAVITVGISVIGAIGITSLFVKVMIGVVLFFAVLASCRSMN